MLTDVLVAEVDLLPKETEEIIPTSLHWKNINQANVAAQQEHSIDPWINF